MLGGKNTITQKLLKSKGKILLPAGSCSGNLSKSGRSEPSSYFYAIHKNHILVDTLQLARNETIEATKQDSITIMAILV